MRCEPSQFSLPLVLALSFLIMFGPLIVAYYMVAYLQVDLGTFERGDQQAPADHGDSRSWRWDLRWEGSRTAAAPPVLSGLSVLVAAGLIWLLPSCTKPTPSASWRIGIVLILMFGAPGLARPGFHPGRTALAGRHDGDGGHRGGMRCGAGALSGRPAVGYAPLLHLLRGGTALTLAALVALVALRPRR